jgi:hypothetical protein
MFYAYVQRFDAIFTMQKNLALFRHPNKAEDAMPPRRRPAEMGTATETGTGTAAPPRVFFYRPDGSNRRPPVPVYRSGLPVTGR